MIDNGYKEIPAYKDMVVGQVYVRQLEDKTWEAKGKARSGKVYALICCDSKSSATLACHIGNCVLAVHKAVLCG